MRKRILSIFCVIICLLPFTIGAFAASEEETESTSFVFEVDVNQRYTDIIDATDDAEFYNIYGAGNDEDEARARRNTYIAILIAALVVAVIILIVSLKRVPQESEITLEGEAKKNRKE